MKANNFEKELFDLAAYVDKIMMKPNYQNY